MSGINESRVYICCRLFSYSDSFSPDVEFETRAIPYWHLLSDKHHIFTLEIPSSSLSAINQYQVLAWYRQSYTLL
jgi:hypothetical protein